MTDREKRRNKKLVEKLNKAAEMINNSGRQGTANYIICSPALAEVIEDLDKKRRQRKERRKKLNKLNNL